MSSSPEKRYLTLSCRNAAVYRRPTRVCVVICVLSSSDERAAAISMSSISSSTYVLFLLIASAIATGWMNLDSLGLTLTDLLITAYLT